MLETILDPRFPLRELAPQLYSVLREADAGAPYDRVAATYDRAVASPLYLKLAWEVSRARNAQFIGEAFASAPGGRPLLRAGHLDTLLGGYGP